MNSNQKVWSENTDSHDDPEVCFQNRISTGISSVIGSEYDLECKLTPFTYINSHDEWHEYIRSELKGNDADDCINKSRNFINGLKLGFEKRLHDAIEDVYNKCRNCGFAETVLRPYLRQLEDKKKAMEEPEPALENLMRIEEEVEAIDCEVVKENCNEAFKSYRKSAEQGLDRRLIQLKKELDDAILDQKRAERDGNYTEAGRLKYDVIPALEKKLQKSNEIDLSGDTLLHSKETDADEC